VLLGFGPNVSFCMHPISHEALLGPLMVSQSTLGAQSQEVAWIGSSVNFCVPPLSHEVLLGHSGGPQTL
jgi:hypothetical protein